MQFLRYFFVGASSAVVDFAVFHYLIEYTTLHYFIAAFIGYMIGLLWNQVLCVLWVFESRHTRTKESIMVFFIALGGLIWTEVILYVGIEWFDMNEQVSKIISQGLVLFWNFGMRKLYVFH